MVEDSTRGLLLGTSILTLFYVLRKTWLYASRTPYPPGPSALPLVGSQWTALISIYRLLLIPVPLDVLDMPTSCLGPSLAKLREKYGPMTWLAVPSRNILVLNEYSAMRDLLDKRSYIYNDRPPSVMLLELVGELSKASFSQSYVAVELRSFIGLNFVTPVLSGDSTWRLHRKLLRPALTVTTIKREYSNLFLADALRYLKAVVRSPQTFDGSLKR